MKEKWWGVALALAGVALYATFVNERLKFGGDAVEYYRLAESLRSGQGYTIDGEFNTKWPPVTPVLLWLGLVLFGPSVAGFKMLGAACALGGLAAAYGWLRRRTDRWRALAVVALSGVMFPFIYWTVDVSSEGPFFLWTMLALYCAGRLEEPGGGWRWAFAGGVATGLAVLTRLVGVSLLVAWGVWAAAGWWRRRGPRPAAVGVAVLVAGVLAGSWLWYSKSRAGMTGFGAYGSLAGQRDVYATEPATVSSVGVWAERVARNAAGYTFIFAIPDSSLRMKAKSPWTPLGLVSAGIMGLAALGWGYHWLRRAGLPEWYALVCAGLLLTYVWYDIRYVVPVLPLVFFYWLWSVEFALGRLLAPSRAAVATAVVAGLFFVANAGMSLVGPQARRLRAAHYHGPAAEIHQAALWVRQQDPKAVIMSRWANMVWFWTRQPAVGVPLLADSGAMWRHMQARQVGFVIVDPDEFSGVTGRYLEPLVQQTGSALELVQQFGRTRVYRVNQ